jgi:hypothetical protein
MRGLAALVMAVMLGVMPAIAADAPVDCTVFEKASMLPADFAEAGHATLLNGLEQSYYENADCTCWDRSRESPDDPSYSCSPTK